MTKMLNAELFEVAALVAGGLGVRGILKAYIRHRTRLQVERERSRRAAARLRGLAHLAGQHATVVLDEQDADGHRTYRTRDPHRRAA